MLILDQMHETIETDNGGLVKAWIDGVLFENHARCQILNVASLPFIHKWVSVMPDVHAGMGATIGSVIPTKGAIIPAGVGVDLGCGMQAVRTTLNSSDLVCDLQVLRDNLERSIPHGRTDNGGRNDRGAWKDPPEDVIASWTCLKDGFDKICQKHPKIKSSNNINHLLTLGTGNHFLEVCVDEEDKVWIMLHTGSRGVGNRIGSYFIELAKKDMKRWFINLPDMNLAYIPEGSENFDDYVEAVRWAQEFARINRDLMMRQAIKILRRNIGDKRNCLIEKDVIDCHHNYVSKEHHYGSDVWVTRKGAVRARRSDMGIIPGSMGSKSYIVKGKGNLESFCSCSHGAGRSMSRSEALRTFTTKDHEKATSHVACRKDKGVVDEIPMAYKDIDQVMAAQSDLVEIVHTLKQIVCIKG